MALVVYNINITLFRAVSKGTTPKSIEEGCRKGRVLTSYIRGVAD